MKSTVGLPGERNQLTSPLRPYAIAIFYRPGAPSVATQDATDGDESRTNQFDTPAPFWTWFTENPRPTLTAVERN